MKNKLQIGATLILLAGYSIYPLGASAASNIKSATGERCTIIGTSGSDFLKGTSKADVICSLGGNDTILGGSGNDIIDGGSGNDKIYGGAGNDTLIGNAGNDKVFGESGIDGISFENIKNVKTKIVANLLLGASSGDGSDQIFAVENITGGAGNDTLTGNNSTNTIVGGPGNDSLFGGAGNDLIDGGAGGDKLQGGTGNDAMVGNTGNDELLGQSGKDTFDGGLGLNSCDVDFVANELRDYTCALLPKLAYLLQTVEGKINSSNVSFDGCTFLLAGYPSGGQVVAQGLVFEGGKVKFHAPAGNYIARVVPPSGTREEIQSCQSNGVMSLYGFPLTIGQGSEPFEINIPELVRTRVTVQNTKGEMLYGAFVGLTNYMDDSCFATNIVGFCMRSEINNYSLVTNKSGYAEILAPPGAKLRASAEVRFAGILLNAPNKDFEVSENVIVPLVVG